MNHASGAPGSSEYWKIIVITAGKLGHFTGW
jgi:hypothetical protein